MRFLALAIISSLAALSLAAPTTPETRDESHLERRRTNEEAASICAAKANNGYIYNMTGVDYRLDRFSETVVAGASVWQSAAGCCQACEAFDGCVTYQWKKNNYNGNMVCYLLQSNHPSSNGPSPSAHCPNGLFSVAAASVVYGSPKDSNPTFGYSCGYPVSGGPYGWSGYYTN